MLLHLLLESKYEPVEHLTHDALRNYAQFRSLSV